ncbi:MAG: hypothetical protein IPF57_14095 [Gammaproteobacteria bacterium]|nr:hypothetical protein [Gammaproteobacteria bacterium]
MLAGAMPRRKKLQRWHEAGHLARDSIAALAAETGIDPQVSGGDGRASTALSRRITTRIFAYGGEPY